MDYVPEDKDDSSVETASDNKGAMNFRCDL